MKVECPTEEELNEVLESMFGVSEKPQYPRLIRWEGDGGYEKGSLMDHLKKNPPQSL
jgi:hypothetical protein